MKNKEIAAKKLGYCFVPEILDLLSPELGVFDEAGKVVRCTEISVPNRVDDIKSYDEFADIITLAQLVEQNNDGVLKVPLLTTESEEKVQEFINSLEYNANDNTLYDAEDYCICEECGNTVLIEECFAVYTANGRRANWCADCRINGAFWCEDCESYHDTSVYDRYGTNCGTVCEDCLNSHYYCCNNCGRYIHEDDVCWHDDQPYCERCCPDDDNPVRPYHNNPTRNYLSVKGETTDKYIGCEIETECGNYEKRIEITEKYGDYENYIYMMHDGSLDSSGIECITQPMSKRFFNQFPFEKWFAELSEAGAKSHDTENCGLHVHLSKTWFGKTTDKQQIVAGIVIDIIKSFENNIKKFSRRNGNDYCIYPSDLCFSAAKKDALIEANKQKTHKKYIEKLKESGKCDHRRYDCLNTCNNETYEFRMFRGTLRPETFRASVELCLRLVAYAKFKDRMRSHTYSWDEFKEFKRLPKVLAEYLTLKNL